MSAPNFDTIITDTVRREVQNQMAGVCNLIAAKIGEVSSALKDPNAAPLPVETTKRRGRPPGKKKADAAPSTDAAATESTKPIEPAAAKEEEVPL